MQPEDLYAVFEKFHLLCNQIMKDVLDGQQQHWETTFARMHDLLGADSSDPARFAATFFKQENVHRILELGGGQGRDTLLFAQSALQVDVLDYAATGIRTIIEKASQSGVSDLVRARQHDVRQPLPFADGTFDACYAHMLYCMALTTAELESLFQEVYRVLRPNGLHVYTVRHTNDAHYGKGVHRGEDMYETGGFIVHFFDRQKIEQLAQGFAVLRIDDFEEGNLPRRLFRVVLRKS